MRGYEQSATLGEVGAGIQMSANAMKVLDHLVVGRGQGVSLAERGLL